MRGARLRRWLFGPHFGAGARGGAPAGYRGEVAPLADLPGGGGSASGRRGRGLPFPDFHYEVNPLLRIVNEGGRDGADPVRKIARYREEALVRFGFLRKAVLRVSAFASQFVWIQLFLLYGLCVVCGAVTWAFLKYGSEHPSAASLRASMGDFSISGPIQVLVGFILSLFVNVRSPPRLYPPPPPPLSPPFWHPLAPLLS